MRLRIAGITKESVVDGPGLRFVVFTQGCPHHCVGCHNPATHDFAGGYEVPVQELWQAIGEVKLLSGITLSGGEPFAQPAACAHLAGLARQHGLTVVTYSGYYFSQLLTMGKTVPAVADLLAATDILIDGPYVEAERDLSLPFRGSRNQNILYLDNLRDVINA